jgi:glycosyltransferase involved in cell wall biosynthesis
MISKRWLTYESRHLPVLGEAEMTQKPFFSIVLPTYNRLYSLKEIFLPSLERQKLSDYELIVVDDASTDSTEAYFNSEEFKKDFPNVSGNTSYLRNSNNKGAPGSRNVGANAATGEWIYIVEDDVQIDDKEFLTKAREIIQNQPKDVAVVSPKRMEGVLSGYYNNPGHSFVRLGVLSGEVYIDPKQEYSGFVENTHASSFIRRDVFLNHQEDEKLFFGNTFRDESDVYIRIRKSGFRIWYAADKIQTVHRNDLAKSGGQKKVNNLSLVRQEMMVIKNHYLYLKKNYSLAPIRILFFILVRLVKHLSRVPGLQFLKTGMSLIRL